MTRPALDLNPFRSKASHQQQPSHNLATQVREFTHFPTCGVLDVRELASELKVPGVVVLVGSGAYRERVAPARSGTLDAPITYTAAPGETAAAS